MTNRREGFTESHGKGTQMSPGSQPVTSLAREVAAGRRATLAEATTQFEAAFSSTFESALDGEEEPPPWRRAFDGEAH